MDQSAHLIELFKELSCPTSQNTQEVTFQIQEFLKNTDSIFLLFQLATNSNTVIRQCSLIFSRQYLQPIAMNIDNIESENLTYLIPLKDQLLSMLVNEPTPQVKNLILGVIEFYSEIIISISTWPEILTLSMQVLQNPAQSLLALQLMYCIYSIIPDEEQAVFFPLYSTLAVNSLLSESLDIRLQAIDCLTEILFDIDESTDAVLHIPNLIDTLRAASERAVMLANEAECSKLFGYLFEAIFYDKYVAFNECLPSFCEFALNVLQNPEISPDIKIKCHQILKEAPRVSVDYFSENFSPYLISTLDLSANMCEFDRSLVDYQFSDNFLSSLSSNSPDADSIYSTVVEFINGNLGRNTPASCQFALFTLSCIVPGCSDVILEDPSFSIDLVFKGLNAEDAQIQYSANELLASLIQNCSSCLSNYLDDLVKIYSGKINDIMFLQTLSILLAYSDRQPFHLIELIQLLLELLNVSNDFSTNFRSDIIQCIANSISHAQLNESLYQNIAPVLLHVSAVDPSVKNDVFNCIGLLLVTSPNSALGDINNIMEGVFSDTSEVHRGCAKTLLAFVENFPVSMAPYTSNTIQYCMQILSFNLDEFIFNNDMSDPVNSEMCSNMAEARGAAIKMLAYLLPDETYFKYVLKMLGSISTTQQFHAVSSLIISGHSLFDPEQVMKWQPGTDPSQLMIKLFEYLYQQEDVMISAEMISAITALISENNPGYILANSEPISAMIMSILKGELTCFTQSDNVEESIMPATYLLFDHFVEIIGGQNFAQILPTFQVKLLDLSKGSNRYMRGYSTLMMAKIACVTQSQDILQLTLTSILMNIKLKHVYLRASIFNSFALILRNPPLWQSNQQLVEMIGQIQQLAHEVLLPIVSGNSENKELFESAAALWARCVFVFHWQDSSVNEAAAVFDKLDVLPDNDNGKSFDLADLFLMLAQNQPNWPLLANFVPKLTVRIFAQNNWYFQRTPQHILAFLKSAFLQNQDVEAIISANVGFNERTKKLIMDRLR